MECVVLKWGIRADEKPAEAEGLKEAVCTSGVT